MKPGPKNWLRPEVPSTVPYAIGHGLPVHPAGCLKLEVSNHGLAVPMPCSAWKGFTRFAVCCCPGVLIVPPLACTVKGMPETTEMIPESFQPPRATEVTPLLNQRFPLPNGSS